MAANWELQLISAILEEQDLDTPERLFQLDTACFISDEAALLYDAISKYWHNRKHYGCVPPASWLLEQFPSIQRVLVMVQLEVAQRLAARPGAARSDAGGGALPAAPWPRRGQCIGPSLRAVSS